MRKVQILLLLLLLPLRIILAEESFYNGTIQAPLYVVDGVPTEPAELPAEDEIYSTTILSDETATQLYGERGKNGVVIISTKESDKHTTASTKAEKAAKTRSYKTYDPRTDKQPLYIVDGHIGVRPDDLPPKEEIAETNELPRATAMDIYGKRATYGAVIIKTKEFVKTHGGNGTRYDNSDTPKRHKKGTPGKLGRWINKITGGNTFLGIILCLIIVFAIMTMPTIVPKLVYRKNSKKGNKRASSKYDPGTFDPEGVRFNAVSQLKNYLLLIFCIIIICMFIVIIFKHIPNMSSVTSLMITLAYFGAMITLFLILFVAQYSKLKSYIIVDEKGLRGILPRESKHFTLKPTFKNVYISWEDIKRAQMDGDVVTFFKKGTKIPDDMVDFAELADTDITEEEIEKSIYEIDLLAFPVNKVRDSINYFYARKMGISKQPALVKPVPFEKSNLLTIILLILAVALLTYLG